MRTRARVTAIPALLSAAVLAQLPGALRVAAHEGHATPEAAGNPWAALGLPELNLTITSDAVEGVPSSIPAGRYLLTVSGEADPEGMPAGTLIIQLPEGVVLDEKAVAEAAAADGPPAFYYDSLLPGGAAVFETGSASAIIDLTPGDWLAAGLALSRPPVAFTVTGEMPTDLPEPASNATFTMDDFSIELTAGALKAGENLLKIENAGVQPHFIDVQKVPDGTTLEQLEATLQSEMMGTPAAGALDMADIQFVAATVDQSGGTTQWVRMTLETGTYAGLCFIADPASGMPHAMMGMYTVFEVAG